MLKKPPRARMPAKRSASPYRAVYEKPLWKPKTLQPTAVLAQLDTIYDSDKLGIHPVDDPAYVDKLIQTLKFAQQQKADFCIFPEYAWPVSAAQKALTAIDKAPAESCVYILPFEHMDVETYFKLMQKFRVEKGKRDDEEKDVRTRLTGSDAKKAIVNVAMVVIRSGKQTQVYPQRKLRPAKLEEAPALRSRFITGDRIRIFKGKRCSFAVMICFDFIARDDGLRARPRDMLVGEDLDLLVVPECNPSPLNEYYLTSMIDLYQAPAWSQRRPLTILSNVGIGTRVGKYRFGFSRMLGNLGKVTESPELRHYDGYVARPNPKASPKPSPKSLSDVDQLHTLVRDEDLQTLIMRPEESVFVVELPTLGGATKSRQAKDTDTNVFIYRPLGAASSWKLVREPPSQSSAAAQDGVPEELVVAGARDAKLDGLRKKILFATPLVLVKGPLGTGKTALVSTTLADIIKHQDRRQRDRVIWIDLASVECSEEALVEHLLLRLGHPADLAQSLDKQYESLRAALHSHPTVLVLDSAHAWPDALPPRLLELHGFKTLLMVASRQEPAWLPKAAQVFDVDRLDLSEFTTLIRNVAKRVPPPMLTLAMYGASQGSALQAAWTGQLIARNAPAAEDLNQYILSEIGPFLPNTGMLLRAGARRGIARLTGRPAPAAANVTEELSFRVVDQWLKSRLTHSALDLLELLCVMPGGFREEDLKKILGPTAIVSSLNKLATRTLIETVGTGETAIHTSHPFARQVWSSAHTAMDATLWNKVVEWARWVLGQYGRNRHPKLSLIVVNQWPNLAYILNELQKRGSEEDRRDFLSLWKLADGFLWAAGRWRERLKFGEHARRIAHELGDVETEITALYDAQAKTLWHRNASAEKAEVLLAEAAALAEKHGQATLRARIEWYRSRMLLHLGKVAMALEVAKNAVLLADASGDAETQVSARINLGNAHREDDAESKAALDHYDAAEAILNAATLEREPETRAVLLRNRGRVHLSRGDFARAIESFEEAMDRFREQKLLVQEARTAVHYAEVLSQIREPWTAEQFLRWGRRHLDPLGSAIMAGRIAAAEAAITEAKRREQ